MANHVPTQAPYDTNASDDANAGTFTIGILGSDGFEDSPPESYTIFFSQSSGVTETNSFCVTTSFGHQDNTWQYHTFSLDNLKYYFNDPAGTNIYYRVRSNNITDYSFSELYTEQSWNLYAGAPFDYNQTDWSAPTGTDACNPYVVTTTTTTTTVPLTIGDPTNQTATVDYENGTVTIDWDAPTDGNTSPERYAIGFGLNDEGTASPYGIATGNVGDENALNTEYTFTASYIELIFNEAHGLFNTAIRSDNDTNSLYSSWTSTLSTTIQNKPAKVSNLASSVDTSGDNLTITWDANDNGFVSASNYKIFSKTDETQWTQVLVTTNTSYSFKATETNSWEFRVDACGSEGDCNSSSTNVTFNYTVPTTTTTLPPPPPPPPAPTTTLAPVEVVVMDDGTKAEYTTDQIAQGDVERDNERKANEDKWGCYVTNVALERGDCDAYNKALYESTTTTTVAEIKEEDVIVEEEIITEEEKIIDDKPIQEDKIPITEDEIIIEDEILEDFEDIVTDRDLVKDDVEEPVKEVKDEEIIDEEPIDDKPIEIIEEDEPIKEDFPDEEEVEIIETNPLPSEEGDPEVQPTREEVKVLVAETNTKVKDIVKIEVDEVKENATKEEIIQAEKELEEQVTNAVKELPKEQKVEIVKEVSKVKVQNLQSADNTTKAVVQAVIKEVTKPEQVDQLTQEEKTEVGKILGFQDDKAAEDLEIVSKQAEKDQNVKKAIDEYVARSIANEEVENLTLADIVTEVQVEAFIQNPIGELLSVNIDLREMDLKSIGADMTSDQKEKAQEVVVPVIIASQIIAQAGALIRRF